MKRLRSIEPGIVASHPALTHADLVHDMRLAIARFLDPLSAFCYALTERENYFVIMGSSIFGQKTYHYWNGTDVVSMPLPWDCWTWLALAPVKFYRKIVTQRSVFFRISCDRRSRFYRTLFTGLILRYDTPSLDFQERFELLLEVSNVMPSDEIDLLECAIGWGSYEVAGFIASHSNVKNLAKASTLLAWNKCDIFYLGYILLHQAGWSSCRTELDPFIFLLRVVGSFRFLFRRFQRFLDAVDGHSLVGLCSGLFEAFDIDYDAGALALNEFEISDPNDMDKRYASLLSHHAISHLTQVPLKRPERIPESVLRVSLASRSHWEKRTVDEWIVILAA
jgi:hypothetical protein